jgi:hypothetical protein
MNKYPIISIFSNRLFRTIRTLHNNNHTNYWMIYSNNDNDIECDIENYKNNLIHDNLKNQNQNYHQNYHQNNNENENIILHNQDSYFISFII